MQWSKEYRSCPICESERFKKIGTRGGASHRDGVGEETMVVQCLDCDAIYTYPTLIPVGNPYETEDDYFAIHSPEKAIETGRMMARKAESLLGRKGSLLEIGCGRGFTLIGARELGWNVRGVEMTVQFAEEGRANGLDIEVAPAENCQSLQGQYDVVLLPAVVEHLYRPVDVLKKIAAALVPGGLLFIETPNERSLAFKIGNLYVRPWSINLSPTFPPYHVVGFSPKSLRTALSLAGFNVKELQITKYDNVLPGGTLKRNIERFCIGTLLRIGRMVNLGDGLSVWAEKPAPARINA